MERRVLALLLGGGAATAASVESVGGWRAALQLADGEGGGRADCEQHQQQRGSGAAVDGLLDAVAAIVPYLPEYNDLSPRLEALLELCWSECPADQTDRVLRSWLERRAELFRTATSGSANTCLGSSSAFRAWLLQWIGQSTHLPASTDTERSQLWRGALRSALLGEQRVENRRTLVALLHRLGPGDAIEEDPPLLSSSTCVDHEVEPASAEALLDFYWRRSHELAPFTLLCAVKLHALSSTDREVSSSSSSNFVQLNDGVLVRLRWYSLLEPLFFQSLVSHCVALQVFQPIIRADDDALHVHDVLRNQVRSARWTKRSAEVLEHLSAEQRSLQETCSARAAHVGLDAATKPSIWNEGTRCLEFLALPEEQQLLVLLDLERDLEDAPAPLFQRILVVLGAIVSSILSHADLQQGSQDDGERVEQAALRTLFALFDLRGDSESCFSVAALVLSLQLPQFPVWTRSPSVFAEAVESLNELLALGSAEPRRWVLQMMLQQLLFESDPAVVQRCLPALRSSLPPRLQRLAALRLP